MKIVWVGLADNNYWNYIAKYCVPSWVNLPGDRYIITDDKDLKINDKFKIIDISNVINKDSKFLKRNEGSRKVHNFWRKMQTQVWAINTMKEYDFVILFDTDIEVFDFNEESFKNTLKELKDKDMVWATGQSQRRGHDSGFIVVNMAHKNVPILFAEYEDIWDSGKINTLPKAYDGDAVETLLEKYPSIKIKNKDYGKGMHVYDLNVVHWGSKEPKAERAAAKSGKELLDKKLKEITPKVFKNS